ncbi:hypothetical protein [Lacinutrix jangbogonensis]|uniref:hypothetical protein n=1 Tax=Lacinutrix jangbogonensis TaxID=1469557 RepID=UPI0012E0100D|nr:hypothetical protein [Lacinutrix jangbogonensis]
MKKRFHWLKEGLVFAIVMFIFSIVLDLVSHDFTWVSFPKRIITWVIGGVFYGLIMYLIYRRSLIKLKNDERNNN